MNWAIEQIKKRQSKREWHKLPPQFEQAQVKATAKIIIEHLAYCDKAGTIKQRIALSKATTFDQLTTICRKYEV